MDNHYPDWYWARGLHDARIKSISEITAFPDWKNGFRDENHLEIRLDAGNTVYEIIDFDDALVYRKNNSH